MSYPKLEGASATYQLVKVERLIHPLEAKLREKNRKGNHSRA